VQGSLVYTGSIYPDLTIADRAVTGKLPDYTTVDLAGGVAHGPWRAELFVKNLFDSAAETHRFVACTICTRPFSYIIQPRTIGLRFGQNF
jgi:iron complex outermembrane recepter protein